MKPILSIGALLAGTAAAAGGVTYFLASGPGSGRSTAAAEVGPGDRVTASPDGSGEVGLLRDELQRLGATVHQLQVEVASLRASSAREPLQVASETPEGAPTTAALTPVQIEQQVRNVLAAEKQREEDQAEQDRIEREKQNAMRQAERIAERLSLAPSDQTLLANHLINAQDKRRALMDQMRDGGFDRNAMRSSFEQMRDWNNSELVRIFGPTVGTQIAEQTNDFGGRGGFGGPGGPGGGRGGRGGGGGGGG